MISLAKADTAIHFMHAATRILLLFWKMAQPEFHRPECFDGSTTDEIHERMMASLPDDIDDMPAGFPYDFTRPAAEEKSEFIN